eukprot:2538712-Prymnesium_polylepis.1
MAPSARLLSGVILYALAKGNFPFEQPKFEPPAPPPPPDEFIAKCAPPPANRLAAPPRRRVHHRHSHGLSRHAPP